MTNYRVGSHILLYKYYELSSQSNISTRNLHFVTFSDICINFSNNNSGYYCLICVTFTRLAVGLQVIALATRTDGATGTVTTLVGAPAIADSAVVHHLHLNP